MREVRFHAMTDAAVRTLVYLLDEAFEGNEEHSLLGNLVNVTPEDWLARPVEGTRTIGEIVDHAGAAKFAYWDHMFSRGQRTFDEWLHESPSRRDRGDIEGVKRWLREGHAAFRDAVAALTDNDLAKPRNGHWRSAAETRWLISVLIEHDVYHAGEINHLRAQRQDDDRWPGRAAQ
jgi:uncharacterized damage-inducible protein DinB